MWVRADDDLEPAADLLRDDPRVDQVELVTNAEVYERVRELAKDDPEYAKLRPEDVGARLDVAARDPSAARSLADNATKTLTDVDSAATLPCFSVPHPVVPLPS